MSPTDRPARARWNAFSALVCAASLVAGCGSKPPPKQADPFDNYTEPPKKAAPPPAPKCEKLDEECKGAKDKTAKVAKTELKLTPPEGWVYAQLEAATIAQVNAEGAVLGIAGVEVADPKKELPQRDVELAALAKELGVTLPKGKPNWKKKADLTEKAGDKTLDMWFEEKGATRGKTKGGFLVLWSAVADKKAVIGVVFTPDKDEASGPLAVDAFKSLAAPPEKK